MPGQRPVSISIAKCMGDGMDGKIILTVFTDPMMGLSYESEPIMEWLKKEYGTQIEFRYVMSLLVKDVADFMTPQERAMEPKEGIRRYCDRLAGIYRHEEKIGGLPVNMEGFCLFDPEHRSSKPLNLAFKAAQLAAPGKSEQFLKALRHATVVACRPTTHFDEIIRVVHDTGINEKAFTRCFQDGSAEAALESDLSLTQRLGIHSLPAYLIQYGGSTLMMQSFDYRDFTAVINLLIARKQKTGMDDTVRYLNHE